MSKKMLTGIDLNNQRALNAADASSPTDLVTLQQLQAYARGLDWKGSVRAATTANITLSATQTVDGVALAVGDRVLVKDQGTASANGIYVVASGAWARSDDADSNAEVTGGMATTVTEGTTNGDKAFILTTNDPITLNTTALAFSQLGGGQAPYAAGNGLTLAGQTFAVQPKVGGGIVSDGTGVSVDTAIVARKFSQAIGDGTATSIPVNHNLNTRDVTVEIQNASTFETVDADIFATTANQVTVSFAAAPAAGAYRVTVVG